MVKIRSAGKSGRGKVCIKLVEMLACSVGKKQIINDVRVFALLLPIPLLSIETDFVLLSLSLVSQTLQETPDLPAVDARPNHPRVKGNHDCLTKMKD